MERNYSFEQRRLLRKIRKNKKERRNRRILGILGFVLITVLVFTPLYMKTNTTRECAIHSIEGNTVIVRHPNDNLYSFTTNTPELFKEDTMITVVFDELTDWDKNYIIKGVK